MTATYTFTTQRQLRAAFWEEHPRAQKTRGKVSGDFHVDTRCQFVDWIDHLCRSGQISERLADRATLDG